MRAIRTFVTGESVRVTVPDASALPAPVCSAVVQAGRQELELNASRRAGRDFVEMQRRFHKRGLYET